MVHAQNINSGQSNFQLGTRSSGSRRNLGYLLDRTLSVLTVPMMSPGRSEVIRRLVELGA